MLGSHRLDKSYRFSQQIGEATTSAAAGAGLNFGSMSTVVCLTKFWEIRMGSPTVC